MAAPREIAVDNDRIGGARQPCKNRLLLIVTPESGLKEAVPGRFHGSTASSFSGLS
jgi:hypothetical protein